MQELNCEQLLPLEGSLQLLLITAGKGFIWQHIVLKAINFIFDNAPEVNFKER